MPAQEADCALLPSSLEDRRIYILGIGNIGRLFAHSLARLPNPPPITLILHRTNLFTKWQEASEKIEIITNGVSNRIGGFDVEVVEPLSPTSALSFPSTGQTPSSSTKGSIIKYLIVATKATQTLTALAALQNRFTSQSTLLFTQNGIGIVEEVTTHLFPNPVNRPLFLTGVIFHGVHSLDAFTSVHAGVGYIPIGDVRLDPGLSSFIPVSSAQPSYLLDLVMAAPAIHALAVSSQELLIVQLEKLVVNVVLNPLTALFRVRNGELYSYPCLAGLIRTVIRETCQVILALPEFTSADSETTGRSVRERFTEDSLGLLVKEKALMTSGNRSSMLQDVEACRDTEIQFINGWVVRRGKQLGVNVRTNERMVDLVTQRSTIKASSLEIDKVFGALR
jgi:2-dehydropantoate 2-reductase